MKKIIIILALLIGIQPVLFAQKTITQDKRIQWWRDARFGLFIHWGLYSIPAGEWKGKEYPQIGERIMKNAKIPVKEYEQLAKLIYSIGARIDEVLSLKMSDIYLNEPNGKNYIAVVVREPKEDRHRYL